MKNIKKAVAGISAFALITGICPMSADALSVNTKYLYSGASHSKYTNEVTYSSPIVTDIDKDGRLEVISVSFAITVTDTATGATEWRVNSGKDRSSAYITTVDGNFGGSWCDPVVKDIDADGWQEIISVHNGMISVLDYTGYFKAGWPKTMPAVGQIRSLAVDDLNGDGKCEIIIGGGVTSEASVWVYDYKGNICNNWPQLSGANVDIAESYGIFANGISTGDIDNDGMPEIIAPTDNRCIQAYEYDGSLVKADYNTFGDHPWGYVRTYIDYDHEKMVSQRGWDTDEGKTDMKERLCMEFGHAGTVIDDLDGDGKNEIVATGIIMDTNDVSNAFWLKSQCMSVAIFNGDRTRYQNVAKGFDWTSIPSGLGGKIKDSQTSVSAMVLAEPVAADLDGDGNKEILFNSYDGKLYCFTLDKQMKTFSLPATSSTVAEYASEPVCKDINGDGKLEIIFGSWTDSKVILTNDAQSENTGVNGSLYILDSNMNLISRTQLPKTYTGYLGSNAQTNGVKSAPVVEDIDYDGEYEVVFNTTYRSVCAYDLTGSTIYDTPFKDLYKHWAKDAVMQCVKSGYLNGTSATAFTPNGTMTRGMMTTVLYRIAGSPSVDVASNPFTDVDNNQWYAKGAIWSAEQGLLNNAGTTFNPNENITREELAYMLYKYSKSTDGANIDLSTFADGNTVSSWAVDAVKYCVNSGILKGSDGKLNPTSTATRAEVATMITRYVNNL
ncbi:MAG TPA: S-layer homology domain-containing protein [Candidatus Butyricicoccus avistercoris]|uniref:S-layer homology domain-containing protein n=1 Tax=Candidatus Butyricicoccus avistercoris TaxID=2838518 RepID=A0A9D1THJ9_9FIRM|nr:S-layer homology domain-containing protein [Candidatus Butyricicoccus avistercoris]